MHINYNILKARESRGLKQEEIARKIGVSRSTYAEWEKEIIPKADIFYKICKEVGYSPDDILTDGWVPDEKSSFKPEEKKDREPSMKEILMILAEGYKTQVETIKSIESKMAQQADQLAIKEKVQDMAPRTKNIEINLNVAGEKLATLERRQDLMIREFREQFLILTSDKKTPSKDVRKKVDRKDGNP